MQMRIHPALCPVAAAAFVSLQVCACVGQGDTDSAAPFTKWGVETLDTIKRDLWMAKRGLYAEKATIDDARATNAAGAVAPSGPSDQRGEKLQPAFMWGAGVQFSALAAAARVDSAYAGQLAAYADVLQTYWMEHDGIGGFSVLPAPARADRYYDDNAWIVLGLIETADVTGDGKYLELARETQRFVMSGEDDRLGGGVYWRERRRRSKNTCSNAPAIVGALSLYQKTNDTKYLEDAKRLYKWTNDNLQDPDDGLYWDNVRVRRGRVDRRKFSYNSALMIRASCLFYEITGEPKYLAEAQRIARAAEEHWIVPSTGAVRDSGKFGHMLMEALVTLGQVDGDPRWLSVASKSAEYVHENVRDPNGRYAHRWDRPQKDALESFMLIDQASAARLYFVLARIDAD
jgi:uncharacterized protein YyaL (SSP411 family)